MRSRSKWRLFAGFCGVTLVMGACATKREIPTQGTVPPEPRPVPIEAESRKELPQAVAPKEFPRIPPADAVAVEVPSGYRAEVVVRDLVYPTSVEIDDQGNLYVAEAGCWPRGAPIPGHRRALAGHPSMGLHPPPDHLPISPSSPLGSDRARVELGPIDA